MLQCNPTTPSSRLTSKTRFRLLRARYRGRPKVQIQAYLSAMAQNLKRLVFLSYLWLITAYRNRSTRVVQYRSLPFSQPDFFNRPEPFSTLRHEGTEHASRSPDWGLWH